MGLFKKKQTFALSDILKGVQYAINSAQEMLHAQQVQNLMKFWQSNDGSCFTDKDVHRLLERKGCKRLNPLDKTDEWFRCSVVDVMAAILSLRTGVANEENRTQNFTMRPEQFRAVEQTRTYFEQALKEKKSLTVFRNFSGMQKCVSERHLPHISWQRRWDYRVY